MNEPMNYNTKQPNLKGGNQRSQKNIASQHREAHTGDSKHEQSKTSLSDSKVRLTLTEKDLLPPVGMEGRYWGQCPMALDDCSDTARRTHLEHDQKTTPCGSHHPNPQLKNHRS
jgi:hypothetical protein